MVKTTTLGATVKFSGVIGDFLRRSKGLVSEGIQEHTVEFKPMGVTGGVCCSQGFKAMQKISSRFKKVQVVLMELKCFGRVKQKPLDL